MTANLIWSSLVLYKRREKYVWFYHFFVVFFLCVCLLVLLVRFVLYTYILRVSIFSRKSIRIVQCLLFICFFVLFVVFFVHINCIKRSRIERSYATKGANKICNDQKKQILKNLNVYFWQQSIFHCFFEEGTLPDTLLTSPHINFFHSLQKSIVRAAFLLPSE